MANQINFEYNGKHYCLEYTRDSIRSMEAAGFNPNDVGDKPAMSLEMLWAGAFIANHRNIGNNLIKSLYDKMKNKSLLFDKLKDMIAETYESLLAENEDDEGNVDWTATL